MMRQQRGFTLLEVMIAIGIFALVGLGTYRMLETVLKTDVATRAHEQSLRELTRAFAEIDRDLAQSIPRTVRDPYGEELASLLGAVDGQVALEFTRAGWRNPMGLARAQLQRVRWRLTGEQLERVYWTVLDQAVDSQPRVQKVLDGVTALELRFLDDQGEWKTQWPPAQGQLTAGAGVQVRAPPLWRADPALSAARGAGRRWGKGTGWLAVAVAVADTDTDTHSYSRS